MAETKKNYNIGTRKSKLAMVQTYEVKGKLEALNPNATFTVYEQDTIGDKVLDVSLSKIGDKGVFTKELEQGLESGAIDFAVHSLKDLPTRLPAGMMLGCVTARVDPCDVVLVRSDLAAKGFKTLSDLNSDASGALWTIGTSSLRRQSQIQKLYPNLKCVDVRGNLDTRIKKLEMASNASGSSAGEKDGVSTANAELTGAQPTSGEIVPYAAIVLAFAGLERQGPQYTARITQRLDDDMFYAVGQGALGIECREGDEVTLKLLSALNDKNTECRTKAERSFLRTLEGGCHAPIGVISSLSGDNLETLTLKGRVLSLDGSVCVQGEHSGPAHDFEQIGRDLAEKLLANGADKIMQSLAPAIPASSH